jgi:peptidoglycan-N-acetylglucosamine deacetylase
MDKRCLLAALTGAALAFCNANAAAAACENANALGVSRVLTIDTTDGPQYGTLQYHANQPLQDKEVVLTFDDGPSGSHTPAVLAALAHHCTKATFFMVGRMAMAYPKMVRAVAAGGHTIGLHTWSHSNLHAISASRAAGEIELGASVVAHALGGPPAPFFRFPYLAAPGSMLSYLKSRGVGVFSIDIDSNDFRTRSGQHMRRTVMRQLRKRGRGIVLMHDIQTSTARGIRDLLDELKKGGYKVVHLVAKSTFKTRPEYDAEAIALHGKRRFFARAAPLNDSSLGQTEIRRGPRARKHTARRRPKAAPTAFYAGPSSSDWKRRVLGLN